MMIKNIEVINNKSFKNYMSPETFAEVNILFGQNGSGKTSLSEWLRKKASGARVFNTEYVRENISVKESINGVRLIIGTKAVETEQNIKTINVANKDIEQLIENKNIQISNMNQNLFKSMSGKLEEAKHKFDIHKSIKQKANANKNPSAAIKMWL